MSEEMVPVARLTSNEIPLALGFITGSHSAHDYRGPADRKCRRKAPGTDLWAVDTDSPSSHYGDSDRICSIPSTIGALEMANAIRLTVLGRTGLPAITAVRVGVLTPARADRSADVQPRRCSSRRRR